MNLQYEIVPDSERSTPALAVRMRAVNEELRGFIRALVSASVREGHRVAEAEAPRGKDEAQNEGHRISDSIQSTGARYRPGGAGGGGSYEALLFASGFIAPHLRYVFEGTADQGEGKIRPAAGNLSGVLAIEKHGEGVHFRRWVHGQRKQDEWWDLAREAVEATLESGIHEMNLDH